MAKLPSGEGSNNGITVSMVGATLGTTSKDVGRLCTNSNINKWSKWKPVSYNKLSGITQTELRAAHYGLLFPPVLTGSFYSSKSELVKMMKPGDAANWRYQPPQGGATSAYRIGDFRNYMHDSIPPLYSNYSKTWDNNPKTLKWFEQDNTLKVNISFSGSQEEGATEWNLKMTDFNFNVFNNQGDTESLLHLSNAHLMIAVFEGNIDPFSTEYTSSNMPLPVSWVVNKDPVTDVDHGLYFNMKATMFKQNGQFNIWTDTMTAKTLVFCLGVNLTANGSIKLYDHRNEYQWTTSNNVPSHAMMIPFTRDHYPVVWLPEWSPANLKPFASDIESGDVYYIKYSTTTGRKWYTLNTTGTYEKAIGSKKYWAYTDERIFLYNGNTNSGQDYKIGISIVIYNNGDQANDFYYSRLIRSIPGADPADIIFLNENQTTKTINDNSYETIASGGSLRIYMWIPGFEVNSGNRWQNSITFSYRDEYAGNYNLVTVPFQYTADSQYNPDSNT